MAIKTKYLGNVKIEQDKTITFENGLPGFIEEKEFTIMDLPGNPIFKVLQSLNTPELAFIVTDPYHFYQDYTFRLDSNILENLKIENEKDVLVFTIVTLTSPFKESTLNLKAPIIINTSKKRGKQYILNDDRHQTKASIVSPVTNQVKGD